MAAIAAVAQKYDGKGERERLAEGERILSDRANGMQVSAMCEKYGLSRGTIYNRIDAAIKARLVPTVDAYREQQNVILDQQMERCQQHLAAAHVLIEQGTALEDPKILEQGMVHHLKAMEMLNRTVERRAKLNGLDMPAKVDVSVTMQDETERAMAALNEQLARVDATA